MTLDRRPPLVYCEAVIDHITRPAPQVVRVTLSSDGLADYTPVRAAEAFRLLLPPTPSAPIVFPETGPDGLPVWSDPATRPLLRGFTVIARGNRSISFDIMDRPGSRWQHAVTIGQAVGIAGMRFGYDAHGVDGAHLLVGDRSGLPAVRSALAGIPLDAVVHALVVGVHDPAERALLGDHPGLRTQWIDEEDGTRMSAHLPKQRPDHAMAVGEVSLVASVHRTLVGDAGMHPSCVQPIVYWQRGMSADQRDPLVYQRYQDAARRGLDVGDPTRVAELELTPVGDAHPRNQPAPG